MVAEAARDFVVQARRETDRRAHWAVGCSVAGFRKDLLDMRQLRGAFFAWQRTSANPASRRDNNEDCAWNESEPESHVPGLIRRGVAHVLAPALVGESGIHDDSALRLSGMDCVPVLLGYGVWCDRRAR